MIRFTDEELAKLPKWVQRRVEAMEKDIQHWKDKIFQMEQGKSNTALDAMTGFGEDRRVYLPNDSTVEFIVGQHQYDKDYIKEAFFDVRVREGRGIRRESEQLAPRVTGIEVMAYSGRIAVYPQSSNVVFLEMDAP